MSKMEQIEISQARLAEMAESGVDIKSRTVYLDPVVDEKTFRLVQACRLLDETKGPITVIINSYGGEEDVGVALFDTLRSCNNQVTTIVISKAYSIAALILQAGDVRLATPNSEIMIHNGSIFLGDEQDLTRKDIHELMHKTSKSDKNYHQMLADATGHSRSQIRKWCSTDTYFSAPKALELNFVDKIIDIKKKRKSK